MKASSCSAVRVLRAKGVHRKKHYGAFLCHLMEDSNNRNLFLVFL